MKEKDNKYKFKKYKPSKDELLWLSELLNHNWRTPDVRGIKRNIHSQLSPGFDYSKIDRRLVHSDKLTLLGLWYVNPEHQLFGHTKLVIEKIKELIISKEIFDFIDSRTLSASLKIPVREIEIIFSFLFNFSFCSGTTGTHLPNTIRFSNESTAYDKFLNFNNIEETLEEHFNRYAGVDHNYSIPITKESKRTKTKSYINQEVWAQIAAEFGINQISFGRKINFVKDLYTRRVIFRDVEDAYQLSKKGFSKAAIILAGGVIEELLRLYLLKKGHTLKKNNFYEYVDMCETNQYLRKGARRLTDSARDYRNLVHIANEASSKTEPISSVASGAVSAIFTIVNDFKR